MPRPGFKKPRSNSKSPRGRVAQKDSFNPAARIQQLERKLAHKAVGERPADSDDSDRLVTRSSSRTRRSGLTQEVYASGAVAKGDKPGAYPTRAQRLRHLERDTKQVIKENMQRRSASASKSASPLPTKSPLNAAHTDHENENASPKPADITTRRSATKSPQNSLTRSQQTPASETSVLGTLKPRRRQASILHMIETNDESTINPEDEEQFLPDDESTPLRTNKPTTASSGSELLSSSRKRKLGSDEPVKSTDEISEAQNHISSSPIVPDSRPQTREPSLPRSETTRSRNKRARLSDPDAQDDDDIMAPPQSSSPEPSPERSTGPEPVKPGKSKSSGPSTKDLQSLMPSKRRQGTRSRTQVNEFDIPEDSSLSDPVKEDSIFLPRKKATRKKEPTPKPKSASSAATGKSSTRAKPNSSHNTSTTPATPRPSTIRTPLPLTRSVNAENRKLRSPLLQTTKDKQPPIKLKSTTNPANQITTGKKGKQSGGSFLPSTEPVAPNTRSTRRTRRTEAMEDQENQNSTTVNPAESSPEAIAVPIDGKDTNNALAQTIELDDNARRDDTIEVEIEVGRGSADDNNDDEDDAIRTPAGAGKELDKGKSKKGSQWTNKWADIDNWDLEYEEVSISTGSSSPGRR